MQTSLFHEDKDTSPVAIDGLTHIPAYITQAEATQLINIIDQQLWLHDLKRRVQHYGYKYDYKARTVTPELKIGALPDWADTIGTRLFADGLVTHKSDQAIVNEYLPGQGIASHIDCVPCFSREIVSLSLAGTCVMGFNHIKTGQNTSLLLQPRDLLILSGPARYEWQHGIAARKSDKISGQNISRKRRISLTFRKVIVEDH
jgi:alkylated DNA repair dioxygenase AlkB